MCWKCPGNVLEFDVSLCVGTLELSASLLSGMNRTTWSLFSELVKRVDTIKSVAEFQEKRSNNETDVKGCERCLVFFLMLQWIARLSSDFFQMKYHLNLILLCTYNDLRCTRRCSSNLMKYCLFQWFPTCGPQAKSGSRGLKKWPSTS